MKKFSFLLLFMFLATQAFGQQVIGKHTGQWVSAGKETNWSGDFKFGHNPDVDTGTDPEDIWETGGTFTVFPDDSTVDVVSTSTSDDTSGTGALTVRIFGVDSSFARIQEDVGLGGTDAVELTNSYRLIYRVIVLTAGSGATNAGTITFDSPGNVTMLTVAIGDAQSQTSIFPISTNETAFLYCWGISNLTASADLTADLMVYNVTGGVWNVKDSNHSRVTGTSAPHRERTIFPQKIDGPAILKITVTTDTDETDVIGHYSILYQ